MGALVLWAAYTLAFLILYALPSDPAAIAADASGSAGSTDPATLAALRSQLGLDEPLWRQYIDAIGGVLHGDLGTSYVTGTSVSTTIGEAIPSTLLLAVAALFVAAVLGGAVAVVATATGSSRVRSALHSLPPIGTALPTFWVGLVLLQLFSFHFRVFPPFGDQGVATLVLPAVTLALPTAAVVAIVSTRALETTWREAFVETVRAKGASRWHVQRHHAIRASSGPVLSLAGVIVGNLLAGSVVVETVYSRAGIGRLTQQSVLAQDIPVVLGLVLVSASVFVVVTIIADLARPLIDPRVLTPRREPAHV